MMNSSNPITSSVSTLRVSTRAIVIFRDPTSTEQISDPKKHIQIVVNKKNRKNEEIRTLKKAKLLL